MANDNFPYFDDPDLPTDPEAAARLREQITALAGNLPASFWPAMRKSLRMMGRLHANLWCQPALNLLPAGITRLTGLTRAQSRRLADLPDQLAFAVEISLRAAGMYFFFSVARHLLDTPLAPDAFRLDVPEELLNSPDKDRIIEHLRGAYGKTYVFWTQQLLPNARLEQPETEWHLLDAQLASLVAQANAQPTRFLLPGRPGDGPAWPLPPAAGEATHSFQLPPGYLLFITMGISCLLLAPHKLVSPWMAGLLDWLPADAWNRLQSIADTEVDRHTDESVWLPLGLSAAADLHLAAHLCGLLAASPAWDELLGNHNRRQAILRDIELTDLLPPDVGLPPPDASPGTMRSEMGLVASGISGEVEELFGADTPLLAANRALAACLAELN